MGFKVNNIGALIIRMGFWGPLYYNYNREPPQNSVGNYLGPYIRGTIGVCGSSGLGPRLGLKLWAFQHCLGGSMLSC